MALEDLAMFRAIPGATVLYPSDAVSMERAVEIVANQKGIGYIRGTRAPTKVIYSDDDEFCIGKSKVGLFDCCLCLISVKLSSYIAALYKLIWLLILNEYINNSVL